MRYNLHLWRSRISLPSLCTSIKCLQWIDSCYKLQLLCYYFWLILNWYFWWKICVSSHHPPLHHVHNHMLHISRHLSLVSPIQATLSGHECDTVARRPRKHRLLEDWAVGGERGHLNSDPGVMPLRASGWRAGDGGVTWEEREADDDLTPKGKMWNVDMT